MIADIQEKFRKMQESGLSGSNRPYKPKNQKKFKDADDGYDGAGRPKRGAARDLQDPDGNMDIRAP